MDAGNMDGENLDTKLPTRELPIPNHATRSATSPYALPMHLGRDLADVLAYWDGRKPADANIPFWSDVQLTALRRHAQTLMIIEVLQGPERFRFLVLGRAIIRRYGSDVESHFLTEVAHRAPFEHLLSQCGTTVRTCAPTFFHHHDGGGRAPDAANSYFRMLLPLWGEGHVAMLLGSVVSAV